MGTLTVKYDGREYEIPEVWIMGMTQRGHTIHSAISYWHYQQTLEERYQAQEENL